MIKGANGRISICFMVGSNKYEPMSEGHNCMVLARRGSSDTFTKDLRILWAISLMS